MNSACLNIVSVERPPSPLNQVAADVRRRKPLVVHAGPPRYLGGYEP